MTWEAVVQLVISLIGTLFVPFAVHHLRGLRQEEKERKAALDKQLDAFELRLRDVEQNKIGKDDWVRTTLQLQRQSREVLERIANLDGKVSASIGIDAQLRRIAEKLPQGDDST